MCACCKSKDMTKSKVLVLMFALSFVIISEGSLTQDIDDAALRARFMRLREIIVGKSHKLIL